MKRIRLVKALHDYKLQIEFEDGLAGQIDLRDRLFGPVFEPLLNPAFFAQASIDDYGIISWPNGADLAPDVLWEQISGSKLS